jgi:hypothetical protein
MPSMTQLDLRSEWNPDRRLLGLRSRRRLIEKVLCSFSVPHKWSLAPLVNATTIRVASLRHDVGVCGTYRVTTPVDGFDGFEGDE